MSFAFPVILVLLQPTSFLLLALDCLSDPAGGAVSEWLCWPWWLAGSKPAGVTARDTCSPLQPWLWAWAALSTGEARGAPGKCHSRTWGEGPTMAVVHDQWVTQDVPRGP